MLKQQWTTTALWEPARKSKHSIKRQEVSRSAQKAEPRLFSAQSMREKQGHVHVKGLNGGKKKKKRKREIVCVFAKMFMSHIDINIATVLMKEKKLI